MKFVFKGALGLCLGAMWAMAAGTIAVTPNNESVVAGGTKQMTATVSGLMSSAVTWSASAGMISSAGLYTAPMAVPSPSSVTVQAISMFDSTVVGTATLSIREAAPPVTSLSPSSVPIGTFSIVVNGSGFQPGATVYNLMTPLITAFVSATQLKATGLASQVGTIQIRVQNPNSMFSAVLGLQVTSGGGSSSALAIQPANAVLPTNANQQFVATYNGSPATVTWSVAGVNNGTITPGGSYTAPAALPSPATVTVTATGPNSSTAIATVTLISNTPPGISVVNPQPVPVGIFALNITGSGFVNGAQAVLNGSPFATQFVSSTQLTASGFAGQNGMQNLVVSNGPVSSQPYALQIGLLNPAVSTAAARRFLQQAAFGPTAADALHVQLIGLNAWIDEQVAAPGVSNFQLAATQGGFSAHFLTNAVTNPDQLRQKVGLALSQIFVTSLQKLIWNQEIAPYEEMLLGGAFGNFRTILGSVTLSPAMGKYLDMANNGKANAAGTILPNENFAREVLQLFTIGTWLLNPDGTQQLDAQNLPIPSYDQKTITELARVFTGWTYAPTTPGAPVVWGAYGNPNAPMMPYPGQHDFTFPKFLFPYLPNGTVGQNATVQQDLDAALDIIFNHPNVAPFIGKQLIQHLVKSNPSPAYVKRVADTFANNGNGVRGDMVAVVKAILLDPEARANDIAGNAQAADGHLQEPVLFLAGLFRGLGAQVNDQNYFAYDLGLMNQDVFNAPSVFNYYSPNYFLGSVHLNGGEFQIYTPYTAIYRDNLVAGIFSSYSNAVQTYGSGFTVDLTPYVNLASTPAALVAALDLALTCGQMPPQMNQIVTQAVTNEVGGSLRRVQTAIYLIATSGYYNVWN